MAEKIIIIGTGGNCIDMLETLLAINTAQQTERFICIGFLDDDEAVQGKVFRDVPVLGPLSSASSHQNARFIFGIGSPRNYLNRKEIMETTELSNAQFVTLVHPTASVSPTATLGPGTVILQNVTVTSNVTIGQHVVVLPNSIVSHDSTVGDFTCIAGGVCVSGGVSIGPACYLGTNSSFLGNIEIGHGTLVGMGSVVLKSLPANSRVAGNPARSLPKHPDPE